MSGGGFGVTGGGGHQGMIGARSAIRSAYGPGWTEQIEKSSADMLKDKGIDPQTFLGEQEMQKKCQCCMAVMAAIAITALVCTLIFIVVWELT